MPGESRVPMIIVPRVAVPMTTPKGDGDVRRRVCIAVG